MQYASTTLTRHTPVFAGWSDGAALGGLDGAWRRGGGAAEGWLQYRHADYGRALNQRECERERERKRERED
jgi:hypothetical protein